VFGSLNLEICLKFGVCDLGFYFPIKTAEASALDIASRFPMIAGSPCQVRMDELISVRSSFRIDEPVKSQFSHYSVIPAKAGIQ
jgi:hypothetical protein